MNNEKKNNYFFSIFFDISLSFTEIVKENAIEPNGTHSPSPTWKNYPPPQ